MSAAPEECDGMKSLFEAENLVDITKSLNSVFSRYFSEQLTLGICCIGFVASLLNIIVVHKVQQRSPVNRILAVIAACCALIHLTTGIRLIGMRIISKPINSYCWMVYLFVHQLLAVLLHTVNIYLAVLLAVIRLSAICFRNRLFSKFNMKCRHLHFINWLCVKLILVLAVFMAPICCIGGIMQREYESFDMEKNETVEVQFYYFAYPARATAFDCFLIKLSLAVIGVLYKLLPCTMLGILIPWLVVSYRSVRARQSRLNNGKRIGGVSQYQEDNNTWHEQEPNSPEQSHKTPQRIHQSEAKITRDSSDGRCLTTDRALSAHSFATPLPSPNAIKNDQLVRVISNLNKRMLPVKLSTAQSPHAKLSNYAKNGSSTYAHTTTVTLVLILLIFLITELPQAVFCILASFYPADLYFTIYPIIGQLFDVMSLLNGIATFCLYCFMNTTFTSRVKSAIVDGCRWSRSKLTLVFMLGRRKANEQDTRLEITLKLESTPSRRVEVLKQEDAHSVLRFNPNTDILL